MHSEFYHNSYLEVYRNPFGAVACGETVTLRISASTSYYGDATLRLWVENSERLIPMMKVHDFTMDEGEDLEERILFEASFTVPEKAGLIWYYFCMADDKTMGYYGNDPSINGGEGFFYEHEPAAYQITVYEKTETPSWWKEGLIYQIFPDRFRNGNVDGHINSPKENSLLQGNWYDRPSYQKDVDGNIMSWIFAGGNFKGITEKLDYLKNMGVSIIYLNPIFESKSNHRYDTANYKKLDPVLGTDEDFDHMIAEGKKRQINFILDGVFSHTGYDSLYFNRFKKFGDGGAYNDPESDYSSWYKFKNFPTEYECWWNFPDLPNLDKKSLSYQNFLCNDDDSVIRTWLRRGIMGFRLDVADELPDEFIKLLRKTVKEENAQAILIGEVWEDASNKQSYDVLREYYYGEELDGVMNYPFREAMIGFGLGHLSADTAATKIMSIMENYPRENLLGCMTLLGSHDRPRAITVLGEACSEKGEIYFHCNETQKQNYQLSEEVYQRGVKRLKMLTALQMALPGTPSVYYGDEVGMQGFMDPYNRGTYPWERGDAGLQDWFYEICHTRREILASFAEGAYLPILVSESCLGFQVIKGAERLYIYTNRQDTEGQYVEFLPHCKESHCMELIEGTLTRLIDGKRYAVTIPPQETRIYRVSNAENMLKMEKSCGVLMHPTSLGGAFQVGDFGERAYQFVDYLKKSNQKLWQILPLNPPGGGDSPYQTLSCFAGSPMLISVEKLRDKGLLTAEEVEREQRRLQEACAPYPENFAPFYESTESKNRLFRLAFNRFKSKERTVALPTVHSEEYQQFLQKNQDWLKDFALFSTLKEQNQTMPWYLWPDLGLRNREPVTMEKAHQDNANEIAFYSFLQFAFSMQWEELRAYANSKGVRIVGDAPIYVSGDSADVWANPKLFKLNEEGTPRKIAGCPPDFFTEEGQLWGNPVFDWEMHKKEHFAWWKRRLKYAFEHHDFMRLDHFRGFEAYWEVPCTESTGKNGKWVYANGLEFFKELERTLGTLPILAEDLGHITPGVKNMKNYFNFPGMEIFQFSDKLKYGCDSYDYLENTALYTGTHDNDTLAGWYSAEKQEDIEPATYVSETIRKLYETPATWVIVPMQDILALGTDCRMNFPGTVGGKNWKWKLTEEQWQSLQESAGDESNALGRLAIENNR